MSIWRKLLLIFILTVLLILPQKAEAAEEFETDFTTTYTVSLSGEATVEQNITLTNKLSNIYATQYALEIGSTRLENVAAYGTGGTPIPFTTKVTDNKTAIVLSFDDKVVGKGQQMIFTVRYKNLDAATKTGNVLEVNVPRVVEEGDIDRFDVIIKVPIQFGEPKIVTPTSFSEQITAGNTIISFATDEIKQTGISAIFGEYQVFNFSLNYNLENPTVTKAITQVVLPPDTAYQKIYFDDITPKPIEIEIDEDGNWLATFDLEPKEKITAVAKGSAVLYLEPVVPIINGKADLSKYLLPQKYWPVNDSQIKNLADELETPKKIYEYIVNNFAYNYDRINGKTGRLGAKEAFNNPQNSICTEFTDAFISLSRAAGIPAREVNGFAYTENSKLKPLSLVADVLHAWPEYYDENRNLWVPVDPTWGNTTGGIDYFSNLDFNHFTLAIHGTNSEKPYPAGYYKFEGEESKDIYIEFSQQTPQEKLSFDVDFGEAKNSFLSGKAKVDLTITNNSNVAVYNLPINLTSEGLKLSSESRVLVPVLLPFDLVTVPVDILNGTKKPTLRVEINGQIYEAEIKISQASDLPIIAIGIVLGSAVGFLSYRAGSLLVSFFRKRGALRR